MRVDNTLPKVEIRTPDNGQRVLKNFTISSLISDLHLVSYQLDFSTTNDSNNSDWEQIYVKESLYQPTDKTELEEVETNKDWEISVKDEQVWLRLIGTDKEDNTNSQTIQVEIPSAVQTRKGGIIASDDQRAELYLPLNTLAQDTIATVNALTETEVEPPVCRVS